MATNHSKKSGSRRAQPLRRKSPAAFGKLAAEQAVPADVTQLLELDHREVEDMFQQFEQSEDDDEKEWLAQRICLSLTVHTEIEEKVFYPQAREVMDEQDLLDEAYVEHAGAKQLVAEIGEMEAGDELYDAKVKVLSEHIKHHVTEEETKLFPLVRDSELDLYEVGKELMARKLALLAEVSEKE
jgi:hemerythrin superfamily protein